MKIFVAVAILLAASAVSAQLRVAEQRPEPGVACHHCPNQVIPFDINHLNPQAPSDSTGNRRLTRKLLGTDGSTVTSQTQYLTKLCPASGNTAYTNVVDSVGNPLYGQLLVDNGICVTSTGRGNVVTASNSTGAIYGGAAQDFGAYKPLWETYGWALFKMPAAPDADTTVAWLQGINLHVIGTVGTGHTGATCSINKISFAIFNADQSSKDISSATPVYSRTLDVSSGLYNHATFSWTSNTTTTLYTDIYNIYDDAVNPLGLSLTVSTYYWLRIKLYTTPVLSVSDRCFAYWGLSSTVGNDASIQARWQETGGASAYSTTCTGAATSPTAYPGAYQTFWNCWNNGVGTSAGGTPSTALLRRCLTFRQTLVPALTSNDCTKTPTGKGGAQFNDFNFAFIGYQGQAGGGGSR